MGRVVGDKAWQVSLKPDSEGLRGLARKPGLSPVASEEQWKVVRQSGWFILDFRKITGP